MPKQLIKDAIKSLKANRKDEEGAGKSVENPSGPDPESFLKAFYADVPREDMSLLSGDVMAAVAKRHYDMACNRAPGTPVIKIQTPELQIGDAPARQTVIDIVNDDMAFLVDSIAAALNEQDYKIFILLHPCLYIRRDKNNAMTDLSTAPAEGYTRQSHIHIRLTTTIPESLIPELEKKINDVLQDVRLSTRDWPSMRERLRECQKALSRAPVDYPELEIEEYLEFLEYLYQDNFTFLGYREYRFADNKGQTTSQTVKGSSLGILHDARKTVFISEESGGLPSDLQRLRKDLPPVFVSKVNRKSTVHRAVPLDSIAVKLFDDKGRVTGEAMFIGLFTSVTYSRSIRSIPFLRMKADRVLHMGSFGADSHDRKALRHIIEKYPRDELFQITTDRLYEVCRSILRLQERQRIALYTREDPFGRYVSCLVYVPKDRFDTKLRIKFQKILEEELDGTIQDYSSTIDDSFLARLLFIIGVPQKNFPTYDESAIEARLQEAGRPWTERLENALVEAGHGVRDAAEIAFHYGPAFPKNYRERYCLEKTILDIAKIGEVEEHERIALDLYRPDRARPHEMRLKIYAPGAPVPLSDILPVLENMGLKVIAELPYEIKTARDKPAIWMHDFEMHFQDPENAPDLEDVKPVFENALHRIWAQDMESDGLNRLVLGAQLTWREIIILRAYVRYLRQARFPFSLRYIEQSLTAHPVICAHMVSLFKTCFDPNEDPAGVDKSRRQQIDAVCAAIESALEEVASLDHDRILRAVYTMIRATLRTNFYQRGPDGATRPALSLKLDSGAVSFLPAPRPYREIYVYTTFVEGIHLRGDKIARGGIRWSDRAEDFRTEVLGLMKAQMVKNALIVPMGAKGGFVVKCPPVPATRDAMQEEGIRCYKTFIRSLLDITDNRQGEDIIPPENVVRLDGEDPYLVVAADKGTATFSDIANSLSTEYGFWMGDAFASGGSAGYDHKQMGITARGAWESVKRHFRELGRDIQNEPFDCIGVGDMGGDVFGNGMLLSRHIQLVGAFNHLHIFCDPDPDPASSYQERERLFHEARGWDAYDTRKLSKGGRIYARSDKRLELTPEIRKRFNIREEHVSPNELIQAMLRARTDLLWFGGIGTYIKASGESHADVGDKGNDYLRINADEAGAKVIGEGANLAITQAARIEFAKGGGLINADFIDNSGGVDSSDHEVNIKIALAPLMEGKSPSLSLKARNKLLEDMTEDVASHVLRNNYQQSQAISLMHLQAAGDLQLQADFIDDLEREKWLVREVEVLPDEDEIAARQRNNTGLTRPELSTLQAYAKITFTQDLMQSDIPDRAEMAEWAVTYFPEAMRKKYKDAIHGHRLKREIIATTIANGLVNRMGPTFVKSRMIKTGSAAADVARAYIIARDSFDLPSLWQRIEDLDTKAPAELQLRALRDVNQLAKRASTWFLSRQGHDLDIGSNIATFSRGIKDLQECMAHIAPRELEKSVSARQRQWHKDGLPEDLARDIAWIPVLGSACDIVSISRDRGTPVSATGRIYFDLGQHFHMDWLRQQARSIPPEDRWAAEALDGLIDQLYNAQAGMSVRVLEDMKDSVGRVKSAGDSADIVKKWLEEHSVQARQLLPVFNEIRRAPVVDIPILIIAEQRLRNLQGG